MTGKAKRRAPKGGGTIYQRGDRPGVWRAEMRQGTKRVRRDFPSRAAAAAWIATQTPQVAHGGKLTLTSWLEEWLKRPSRKQVSERTLSSYRWVAEVWSGTSLGRRSLNTLTPELIEDQLDEWSQTRAYSRTSISQLRTVLGTALNWAVRKRKIPVNVVTAVQLADAPGPNRVRQLRISNKLVQDLSDAWLNSPWRGPFELSIHTGLRPAELLGLTWGSIDQENHIVTVRQSVKSERKKGAKTRWFIGKPKTSESNRDVSYSATVAPAIEEFWEAQGRPEPDAWFVPHPDKAITDLPMIPDQLSRIFRDLVDSEGVGFLPRAKRSQLRLYDLRAIHASLLLARGVPATNVAARLGHTDIQSLMRRYAGVVSDNDKKAASLGRVWEPRQVPADKRKRRPRGERAGAV